MRMATRSYHVRDLRFGPETAYEDGVLTVCREELAAMLSRSAAFKKLDIRIACPGEAKRITNILEIVPPRVKTVSGRRSYFPGILNTQFQAGFGKHNTLQGCTVMEVGQRPGLLCGVVDMQGPAAALTPFSKTCNLCLVAEPATGVASSEYCMALKKAGLRTAVYLAESTMDRHPDNIEIFDLEERSSVAEGLPRVGYLFQLYSGNNARHSFLYGARYCGYYPTFLHPNEILDGALVCGHYSAPFALKIPTYTLLNHPIVLELYRRHGREIDFRGVIIAPEPTTMEEIQRTAIMSSSLLEHCLGVQGVIITKEGGGHTSVNLMACCDACEASNISTVLMDYEYLGTEGDGDLPVLCTTPNADAMVSIGNIEKMVELGPMENVIGGERAPEMDVDMATGGKVPIGMIPEAISQLGGGRPKSETKNHGEPKQNSDRSEPASRRAVDMLLKKMSGIPWESEIQLPKSTWW